MIKQGDFIACPPSEKGAHKLTNSSDREVLKYIDFDTTNSPDVLSYPDSNKIGIIFHNQSSVFFNNEDMANYYDGEDNS